MIRHSTAHLLAKAVQAIFPKAQVTIGPVIENGFYYDFAYKRPVHAGGPGGDREARWRELAARTSRSRAACMPRDEAVAFFKGMGENYKAEIIASIPAERGRSRCTAQGDFDRPVPRPARAVHRQAQGLQADEGRRRVLARRLAQRDAAAHLRHGVGQRRRIWTRTCTMLEEAEKRDHRKLGKRARPVPLPGRGAGRGVLASEGLGDLAAGRAVHARASTGRSRLPGGERARDHGRVAVGEVRPLEKFGENMFLTKTPEKRDFAIKPMNCPGHIQIFNQGMRSYRDLPLRYARVRQGAIATSPRARCTA